MTRPVFWQNVPMAPAGVPLGPDAPRSGFVVLFTVGHLMIVVLGLDPEFGDSFTVEGLPADTFQPIWPVPRHKIHIPDGLVLNDLGIKTLWPPKGVAVREG